MGGFAHTLFYFAVALGILISFHEFGHFWVARKLGVKVLRFSVGFGRKLWSHQKDPESTEYVVAVLPLGGYVKMVDEREGDVAEKDLPYAFNRQSLPVRTAIVLAGPFFNLFLAVLLYWCVFYIGETGTRPLLGEVKGETFAAQSGFQVGDEILSVGGEKTPTWGVAMSRLLTLILDHQQISIVVKTEVGENVTRTLSVPLEAQEKPDILKSKLGFSPWEPALPPVIASITEGGAAERSGMKSGDLVLTADGTKIKNWQHWVDVVRSKPEVDINVVIDRDGVHMPLVLKPDAIESEKEVIGRIGASVTIPPEIYEHLKVDYRLAAGPALSAAISRTFDYSLLTFKMIGRMIIGRASVENLSGPISIAKYAGQSASMGMIQFIKFLAIISISLGVVNLLPIPVLDGGHLLFFLIEAIKGSPLSDNAQLIGQQVGIAILFLLMSLAVFLDIERLFT